MRQTPSYKGLAPSSARASKAAKASSKKSGTRSELLLRQALWALGLRYRVNVKELPGKPDIVFQRAKVAVFCDGDFWHGRDLGRRLEKLANGHNAPYWVAKINGNVARDRDQDALLRQLGWTVLRFWESDVLKDPVGIAVQIEGLIKNKSV